MASTRRPTYKVEIKPLNERKRRKSDLVIMWQSIWDFTLSILGKLWHVSNTFWETADIWAKVDERREIQLWLEANFSKIPNDFSSSWRDGVLLCILLNKLHPGCYPDAEELDINFAVKNVHNAFNILEVYFNIVPKVTVEEIVTCRPGSDSKLVQLLLQLKQEAENNCLAVKPSEASDEKKDSNSDAVCSDLNTCIAKGTGLLVGFAGRVANFVIFYSSMSDLDLVIEIKGPSNSVCSERITYRSPRKKRIVKSWKPSSRGSVMRSISDGEKSSSAASNDSEMKEKTEQKNISLEYEIHMNQINISYTPLVKGRHKVMILYHGKHVSDSPYEVIIEPSVGTYRNNANARSKSSLAPANPQQKHGGADFKKESIPLEESGGKKDRLGKVINRRILRYIVKIDRKDIVVEADCISNLATSLLKMDYELQKCPLSRRNSWGFVGDAERKVSVIRQFCVDADELEAQSSKIHRSHSLVLNNNAKKLPSKSTSYECEDIPLRKKLETVTEGCDPDITKLPFQQDRDNEAQAYFTGVFESKNEISTAREKQYQNARELSYSPEEIQKLISTCSEESISKATLFNNSDRSLAASSLESQDTIATLNNKSSPDHSMMTSESSVRIETDINEDALPSIPLLISENVNHLFKGDSEKSNHSGQKKSKLLTREENYFKMRQSESLCVKQVNQTDEKPKHCENTLIKENSVCKMHATNSKNFFCQYNERLSPTFLNFQRSWHENAEETPDENIYLKQDRKKVKFLGNVKKFPNSVTGTFKLKKVLQSQVNRELIKHYRAFIYKKYRQKQLKNEDERFKTKSKLRFYLKRLFSFEKMQRQLCCSSKCSEWPSQNKNLLEIKNSKTHSSENVLHKDRYETPDTCYVNIFANTAEKHGASSKSHAFTPRYKKYAKNASNEICLSYSKENGYEKETFSSLHAKNKSTFLRFERNSSDGNFGKNHFKTEPKNFSSSIPSAQEKNMSILQNPVFALYPENNTNQPFPTKKSVETSTEKLRESTVGAKNSTLRSTECFSVTTRNLVSLGQFNFKHFNPPPENKTTSRVRNRIKQWQSTANENRKEHKKTVVTEIMPETIDIQSKVKFWENLNKKDTSGFKNKEQNSEYCRKESMYLLNETNGSNADIVSHVAGADYEKSLETATPQASQQKNNSRSINQEFNISCEKHTDEKLLLPIYPTKVRKRSFSDPCVKAKQEKDAECVQQLEEILHQATSREDLSSSTDANYVELSADDEVSSADLLYSTEDEYIDDEITENMSTYWGDLSLVKNLKISGSSAYKEFCSFLESEYFKDRNPSLKSSPYECQVFGISNYFGHVSVKNRFWVLSTGAGYGNLSATVQGARQYDVAFVSVEYMQKDVYEVTYQVLTPGLYLISIRWMETPILGSPFLCKVTY